MTLIRELIAIPEQVHQGVFVLMLADGARMGDYYESIVTDEARALQSPDDLRDWRPQTSTKIRKRKGSVQ